MDLERKIDKMHDLIDRILFKIVAIISITEGTSLLKKKRKLKLLFNNLLKHLFTLYNFKYNTLI